MAVSSGKNLYAMIELNFDLIGASNGSFYMYGNISRCKIMIESGGVLYKLYVVFVNVVKAGFCKSDCEGSKKYPKKANLRFMPYKKEYTRCLETNTFK